MKPKLHRRGNALRRLAGWGALLLYVAAFSPFGVGLAAALGWLDCDHQVKLQSTESGLRVVLHHEQECLVHHHGALARALTLFAPPVSSAQRDHVLQFSSTDNITCANTITAAPKAEAMPLPAILPPFTHCHRRQLLRATIPSRAPPDESGRLACLRSTVLLI